MRECFWKCIEILGYYFILLFVGLGLGLYRFGPVQIWIVHFWIVQIWSCTDLGYTDLGCTDLSVQIWMYRSVRLTNQ